MKKLFLLPLIFCCLVSFSQQMSLKTDSSKWIPNINASISGVVLQYVGGSQSIIESSFTSVAYGFSWQKINTRTKNIDLDVDLNLLNGIKIGTSSNVSLGVGVGFGFLNNVLKPGFGYFFGQKYPCGMININIIPLINQLSNL
jgi:hypothetical protein